MRKAKNEETLGRLPDGRTLVGWTSDKHFFAVSQDGSKELLNIKTVIGLFEQAIVNSAAREQAGDRGGDNNRPPACESAIRIERPRQVSAGALGPGEEPGSSSSDHVHRFTRVGVRDQPSTGMRVDDSLPLPASKTNLPVLSEGQGKKLYCTALQECFSREKQKAEKESRSKKKQRDFTTKEWKVLQGPATMGWRPHLCRTNYISSFRNDECILNNVPIAALMMESDRFSWERGLPRKLVLNLREGLVWYHRPLNDMLLSQVGCGKLDGPFLNLALVGENDYEYLALHVSRPWLAAARACGVFLLELEYCFSRPKLMRTYCISYPRGLLLDDTGNWNPRDWLKRERHQKQFAKRVRT